MIYRRPVQIEFNHCDPAGIVFYPRYFEMTNSVAENFFATIAGYSYARMMAERCGVPTVRIEVDFKSPSRLGEVVEFTLAPLKLGRSSLNVRIAATGPSGDLRLTAAITLVWVGPDGRSAPWPAALRAKLEAALEE